jgi:hypothetical protein
MQVELAESAYSLGATREAVPASARVAPSSMMMKSPA